jgi:hypothetical protein
MDFGAKPIYKCDVTYSGSKWCGTYTNFAYDGLAVSLTDFVWQKTSKHGHSVCLSRPFETTHVCGNSDGEVWAQDTGIPTKQYRQRW